MSAKITNPLTVLTTIPDDVDALPLASWGIEARNAGSVDHGATARAHLTAAAQNLGDAFVPGLSLVRFADARKDAQSGSDVALVAGGIYGVAEAVGTLVWLPSPLGVPLPLRTYVAGAALVGNLYQAGRHAALLGLEALVGAEQ